jgi:hypothetical protein
MTESRNERAPPEIREQFKYEPVYCSECETPVSVVLKDDPQPLRWECSCAVGYPTGVLPDQWFMPDPDNLSETADKEDA